MRRLILLLMLACLCLGWQKKPKGPKPPEVLVLQASCQRAEGDVVVDGRLKIQGTRAITKLSLLIDFLGADKQLLQTKRGMVEESQLKPGDEAEFHMRIADPVRAVLYTLRAEDGDGRDYRVENPGPFPIE